MFKLLAQHTFLFACTRRIVVKLVPENARKKYYKRLEHACIEVDSEDMYYSRLDDLAIARSLLGL